MWDGENWSHIVTSEQFLHKNTNSPHVDHSKQPGAGQCNHSTPDRDMSSQGMDTGIPSTGGGRAQVKRSRATTHRLTAHSPAPRPQYLLLLKSKFGKPGNYPPMPPIAEQ